MQRRFANQKGRIAHTPEKNGRARRPQIQKPVVPNGKTFGLGCFRPHGSSLFRSRLSGKNAAAHERQKEAAQGKKATGRMHGWMARGRRAGRPPAGARERPGKPVSAQRLLALSKQYSGHSRAPEYWFVPQGRGSTGQSGRQRPERRCPYPRPWSRRAGLPCLRSGNWRKYPQRCVGSAPD